MPWLLYLVACMGSVAENRSVGRAVIAGARRAALVALLFTASGCVEAGSPVFDTDAFGRDGGVPPIRDGGGDRGGDDPETDEDTADDTPDGSADADADGSASDDATPDADGSGTEDTDTDTDTTEDVDAGGDVVVVNPPCSSEGLCSDGRVCVDGACVQVVCTEGLTGCDDSTTLRRCVDGGTRFEREDCTDGATCPEGVCGCRIDACVRIEVCTPRVSRCNGDVVERCATSGDHFARGSDCAAAERVCVDGECGCGEAASECDDACVDTQTDTKHCGGCGITCAALEACVDGVCTCESPGELCADACVDPRTDTDHCGECGAECKPGAVCVDKACECAESLVDCGSSCSDLETDNAHCGACGASCGASQACRDGRCECITSSLEECGTECVDTERDLSNCGGCGRACGVNQICVDGGCRCLDGRTACGTLCVDTESDEAHCGGCNLVCNGSCIDGACKPRTCDCEFLEIWCPISPTCTSPEGCCSPFFLGCTILGQVECIP